MIWRSEEGPLLSGVSLAAAGVPIFFPDLDVLRTIQ
jgi:hypothetical protein